MQRSRSSPSAHTDPESLPGKPAEKEPSPSPRPPALKPPTIDPKLGDQAWTPTFDKPDLDHQHVRSPSVEFSPLLKQQPSPYGSRAAVVALALALQSGSPAVAQVYCSQRAIVIDAPSNIRTAPNSRAPIACQLRRNGRVILVLPAGQRLAATGQAAGTAADWYATMACYSDPQSRAVGLGRPPHYIHRSQVRIKGINPADWTAPAAPGESNSPTSGGCERLWQPSHQP